MLYSYFENLRPQHDRLEIVLLPPPEPCYWASRDTLYVRIVVRSRCVRAPETVRPVMEFTLPAGGSEGGMAEDRRSRHVA